MSKRRCVETAPVNTSQPEENLNTKPVKVAMFDDDPHQLLLHSVALTLEHVGFKGASPEALEALCAEIDTC